MMLQSIQIHKKVLEITITAETQTPLRGLGATLLAQMEQFRENPVHLRHAKNTPLPYQQRLNPSAEKQPLPPQTALSQPKLRREMFQLCSQ